MTYLIRECVWRRRDVVLVMRELCQSVVCVVEGKTPTTPWRLVKITPLEVSLWGGNPFCWVGNNCGLFGPE
jgi:hypothetical protein